ncbi:hypothetical protein [Algivirga pacifica]|uniref:Lipocalin-like domain-containing protein n=1 Tax=Algivirga pacifica TaxID=1162670 RepID=A0ABP9DP15_9BACT
MKHFSLIPLLFILIQFSSCQSEIRPTKKELQGSWREFKYVGGIAGLNETIPSGKASILHFDGGKYEVELPEMLTPYFELAEGDREGSYKLSYDESLILKKETLMISLTDTWGGILEINGDTMSIGQDVYDGTAVVYLRVTE